MISAYLKKYLSFLWVAGQRGEHEIGEFTEVMVGPDYFNDPANLCEESDFAVSVTE